MRPRAVPTTMITAMVNIDDYWTRPTSALVGHDRFSAPELGEDDLPGAYLETDGQLVLGAVEYLGFATDRGDLDGHVDGDGWLTPAARDKARDLMRRYLAEARVPGAENLQADDCTGGDDPHIDFSLVVPASGSQTVEQLHAAVIAPFFATVQNVTDPGTFNRPYIWADLSR